MPVTQPISVDILAEEARKRKAAAEKARLAVERILQPPAPAPPPAAPPTPDMLLQGGPQPAPQLGGELGLRRLAGFAIQQYGQEAQQRGVTPAQIFTERYQRGLPSSLQSALAAPGMPEPLQARVQQAAATYNVLQGIRPVQAQERFATGIQETAQRAIEAQQAIEAQPVARGLQEREDRLSAQNRAEIWASSLTGKPVKLTQEDMTYLIQNYERQPPGMREALLGHPESMGTKLIRELKGLITPVPQAKGLPPGLQFLASPVGAASLVIPPLRALRVPTLVGVAGEEAAGTAAKLAGAPPKVELGARIAGGVLTPGAGLVAGLGGVVRTGERVTLAAATRAAARDIEERVARGASLTDIGARELQNASALLSQKAGAAVVEELARRGATPVAAVGRSLAPPVAGLAPVIHEATETGPIGLPLRTLETIERGPNIVYSSQTPEDAARIAAGQERRRINTTAEPGDTKVRDEGVVMAFEATGEPVRRYKIKGGALYEPGQLRPLSQMDIGEVHAAPERAAAAPIKEAPVLAREGAGAREAVPGLAPETAATTEAQTTAREAGLPRTAGAARVQPAKGGTHTSLTPEAAETTAKEAQDPVETLLGAITTEERGQAPFVGQVYGDIKAAIHQWRDEGAQAARTLGRSMRAKAASYMTRLDAEVATNLPERVKLRVVRLRERAGDLPKRLPREARIAVTGYLDDFDDATRDRFLAMIPENVRPVVAEMRRDIDELGDLLVQAGILNADKRVGNYISHLVNMAEEDNLFKVFGRVRRGPTAREFFEKPRSYQTFADLIATDHEVATLDPFQLYEAFMTAGERRLINANAIDQIRHLDPEMVRWLAPGQAVPEGFVKIDHPLFRGQVAVPITEANLRKAAKNAGLRFGKVGANTKAYERGERFVIWEGDQRVGFSSTDDARVYLEKRGYAVTGPEVEARIVRPSWVVQKDAARYFRALFEPSLIRRFPLGAATLKTTAALKRTVLATPLFDNFIGFEVKALSYAVGKDAARSMARGLRVAISDPIGWANFMEQPIRYAGQDMKRIEAYQRLRRAGLTGASYRTEIARMLGEETPSRSVLGYIPIVGDWYDSALSATEKVMFDRLIPTMKTEGAAILVERKMAQNPGMALDRAEELAANDMNKAMGGLNRVAAGRSQTTQDILAVFAIAPDWLESRIRNYVGAFVPGPHTATSRRFVARSMVVMTGATVTGSLVYGNLQGWSPERIGSYIRKNLQPVLIVDGKPRTNPHFLEWQLPNGQWASLGTWEKDLWRVTAGVAAYSAGDFKTGDYLAGRFFMSRAGFIPRTGFDVLRNRNWRDDPITTSKTTWGRTADYLKWFGANFGLPATGQEIGGALIPGFPSRGGGTALSAAINVSGFGRVSPKRMMDYVGELRDDESLKRGFTGWSDPALDQPAREEIDKLPAIQAWLDEGGRDIPDAQKTPEQRYYDYVDKTNAAGLTRQQEIDGQFPANGGDWWANETSNNSQETFLKKLGAEEALGITFKEREATNPVDVALQAYFTVDSETFRQPDGFIDWQGFFGAQDAALASLPSDDRQRAIEYIHKRWTPLQWEHYYDVQKIEQAGYWSVKDAVANDYEGTTYDQVQAGAEAGDRRLQGRLKQIDRAVTAKRKAMRRNRELEALLEKWSFVQKP